MTVDISGPLEIDELLAARLTQLSSTLAQFSDYYYAEVYPKTNLHDARYILVLGAQGEGSATDIARKLSFDKATVSRNISRLIKQGVLCKTKDHNDARRSSLTLTEKGQDIYRTISSSVRLRDHAALSVLTDGERMMLFELLGKLQSAANHRLEAMEEMGYDPAIKYEE